VGSGEWVWGAKSGGEANTSRETRSIKGKSGQARPATVRDRHEGHSLRGGRKNAEGSWNLLKPSNPRRG
jgi:hypothetical protein